jgi:hypothetical protein
VSHIVHYSASGPRNIDALFFMLGWDLNRFDKRHGGTCYIKLMFLHPVGSACNVVHYGASGA